MRHFDPKEPHVRSEGVLRATNLGQQLVTMNAGLPPNLQVSSLAITPSGDTLYAGTASGGVYQFTGAGPPVSANYEGMWWYSPAGSESGWGINFAHQGDTIFATWFTFGLDGNPQWLVVAANKPAPNVYSGTLYTGTGPAFNSVPFDPTKVVATPVGTATLTFSDGNSALFAYTVNGVAQAKQITRQVFVAPGTACQ